MIFVINGVNGHHAKMTAEQFNEWLKRVDANGDGLISKKELREALSTLGLHFKRWKARRALAHADLNRNRHIDGDLEFKKLVDYARKRWGIIVE